MTQGSIFTCVHDAQSAALPTSVISAAHPYVITCSLAFFPLQARAASRSPWLAAQPTSRRWVGPIVTAYGWQAGLALRMHHNLCELTVSFNLVTLSKPVS